MADVTGTLSESVVSVLDIYRPSIDNKFYQKYLREDGILEYIEMFGQTVEMVDQSEYFHYEEVRINSAISAGAAVSDPGVGNSVTITLSSADHRFSGTKSYPQVGELAIVLKSNVVGYVTSVDHTTPSAHTVTLVPVDTSKSFGAVSIGDPVFFYGNAYAEGTGQPDGHIPDVAKYNFKLQIHKATFEATGSEYGNADWVEFTNPSTGETGRFMVILGEANTARRFRLAMEANCLITPAATNTVMTDAGVRTSTGLLPWIEGNNGIVDNYNRFGYTFDRFKNMIKRVDKVFGQANEYLIWAGIDLREEFDIWAQDMMKNGSFTYGAFNGNKEAALQLSFQQFSTLGYTFHLKTQRLFSDGKTFGADGSNWPGYGFVIPYGTTIDKGTNKATNYMRMRVKTSHNYDRSNMRWLTGLGPSVQLSQTDKMQINYLSERGAEWFAPQLFGAIKRVNG